MPQPGVSTKLHVFLRRAILFPFFIHFAPIIYCIGFLVEGHDAAWEVTRDVLHLCWHGTNV